MQSKTTNVTNEPILDMGYCATISYHKRIKQKDTGGGGGGGNLASSSKLIKQAFKLWAVKENYFEKNKTE